jgi:hypothetical protein
MSMSMAQSYWLGRAAQRRQRFLEASEGCDGCRGAVGEELG